MEQIIGTYKQFIIVERDALIEFENKAKQIMDSAQNDHNVEDIRKAKVMFECIEWIKENNIYNKDFKLKH